MARRPIIVAPDRRLKVRSTPVETIDDSVRALLDDMLETMYAEDGVGLAAIQVGVPKRLVVADVHPKDAPPAPIKLINPEIVEVSEDLIVHEEGCLSLPDQFAEVERPVKARIRYLDETGTPQEREFEGVLAVCLQHEIDHLEGILFVDHISAIRRNIILRRLQKLKRAEAMSA
ncbi:MAG: peptide deformylase [Alphaproteobacteria bacterium]